MTRCLATAALAIGLSLPVAAVGRGATVAEASPLASGAAYLASRATADGGFAEPGRNPEPGLTAWAVLGLHAAGMQTRASATYLAGQPYPTATDLELRILALAALGSDVRPLVSRLAGLRRASGAIGPGLNSTIFGVLAFRAALRPAGTRTVAYLLRQQRPDGGWSWAAGVAADSNDTAAAIQALRAAGIAAAAKELRRGVAYLRTLQNPDGGFELSEGRGSDAQSTAWAIQAFVAAGRNPGRAAFSYLEGLQRPDGSFRYSAGYATTPVWVTAQVLPALARRPLPLR